MTIKEMGQQIEQQFRIAIHRLMPEGMAAPYPAERPEGAPRFDATVFIHPLAMGISPEEFVARHASAVASSLVLKLVEGRTWPRLAFGKLDIEELFNPAMDGAQIAITATVWEAPA